MRSLWALLAALVFGTSVPASAACSIANVDLSRRLRALPQHPAVVSSRWADLRSGDPVLRHVLAYAGGVTLVVDQNNCVLWRARVTLLSPRATPDADDQRKMVAALRTMPLWRRSFARVDAAALFGRELGDTFGRIDPDAGGSIVHAVDDPRLRTGDQGEMLLSVTAQGRDAPGPYLSMTTLAITAD